MYYLFLHISDAECRLKVPGRSIRATDPVEKVGSYVLQEYVMGSGQIPSLGFRIPGSCPKLKYSQCQETRGSSGLGKTDHQGIIGYLSQSLIVSLSNASSLLRLYKKPLESDLIDWELDSNYQAAGPPRETLSSWRCKKAELRPSVSRGVVDMAINHV